MALIFFLTSLFILASAITYAVKDRSKKAILTVGVSGAYCIFCLVAFGKAAGFIPASPIEELAHQNGFDLRGLPIQIKDTVGYACALGAVFNLMTALWILKFRGFWRWCICSVSGFCIICAAAGPVFGMSPLFSLFGGCCAFMLLVGWVFGLTYIQFCVIGNIWIPIIAVVTSALTLLYVSFLNKKVSGGVRSLISFWSMSQCAVAAIIGLHYALPMKEAFFLCVSDLRQLACVFHTTYEIINLVIYVIGIVAVLAVNIMLIRRYRPSEK